MKSWRTSIRDDVASNMNDQSSVLPELAPEPSAPDELTLLQQIDAAERRKVADRAAFQAEFFEIMATVVEALPDALIIVNEAGEITLLNAQAELLFGYHRDQLIGKTIEILLPERFRSSHIEHRASCLAEPRVRSMGSLGEIVCRRRDGQEVRAHIMLSPVVTRAGIYTLSVVRRRRHD
jgi:PAS domain S-box-containing protein